MTDQAKTFAPFIQRREKNLEYFRQNFNDIYELFKNYQLTEMQLNILTETDECNLLKSDGTHVYPEGAKLFADKEVETFKLAYHEGKKICSFRPPFSGDYAYPRFGQTAVDSLLQKSPVNRENFSFYELEDFYPLIVFLGCGLGYHIEQMVEKDVVQNMIIVEPNLDKFAASLYAVDWAHMCERYKASNGRTLHFILGAEENEYLLWAVTWNRLIDLSPHFPVMTLFYNHQGREIFDNVSSRVNKDLLVFLLSWGHYDDEIRQLNNALHNVHNGVKELPKPMKEPSQTPVFIIGSGPSLDDRIEYIKDVQDEVILISCGTALKTLATYGLKPDIHVELESDLLAYIAVAQAAPEGFYKDVKLVGPSHISPLIYQLFGDGRMYYKAESVTASLLGMENGHVIKNGTPTCTNLGVALAVSMGFKQLFLFGLDFGFKDKERHHAKGSIYYEKILEKTQKSKQLVKIEAVDGGEAWSTHNYFTSKRKVENLLNQHCHDEALEVYNCSDVAKIENAEWLPADTFLEKVKHAESNKQRDLAYMFDENATSCDVARINQNLKYIEVNLKALGRDLYKILDVPIESMEALSLICARVNWYLEEVLKKRMPDMYYFVRGTMRHFLCAGFAHGFAAGESEARTKFIEDWKRDFLNFFNLVPEHFASVVFKDFDTAKDPWVKQSMRDPEDGINEFFTRPLEEIHYE